jgi:hypothetical protein
MKRQSTGPKGTLARAKQPARSLCNPVGQHRRGPFEFSCSFDDARAFRWKNRSAKEKEKEKDNENRNQNRRHN